MEKALSIGHGRDELLLFLEDVRKGKRMFDWLWQSSQQGGEEKLPN